MAYHGGDSDRTWNNFIKLKIQLRFNLGDILPYAHFPETSNKRRKTGFGFQSLVMLYIFVRNSRRDTYKSNYNYSNKLCVQYECIYIDLCVHVKNKLRSWVDRWVERVLHGKCVGEWDVQGDVARHAAVDRSRRKCPTNFSFSFLPFSSCFSSLLPVPRERLEFD